MAEGGWRDIETGAICVVDARVRERGRRVAGRGGEQATTTNTRKCAKFTRSLAIFFGDHRKSAWK